MVPLVYNITNSVVQDFTANALLALGASPIMSDAVEEAAHGLSGTNKRATSTRGVTGCATPIYAKRLTRSGPDVNDDTAGPEPIIGSTSFVACARAEVTHLITEFARDSLLEGDGFEPSVPRSRERTSGAKSDL